MKLLAIGFGLMILISASPAFAQDGKGFAAAAAAAQKPLKVYGQSRTLNMTMVLQGKKDKLQGVNPRQNYNKEIPKTNY